MRTVAKALENVLIFRKTSFCYYLLLLVNDVFVQHDAYFLVTKRL